MPRHRCDIAFLARLSPRERVAMNILLIGILRWQRKHKCRFAQELEVPGSFAEEKLVGLEMQYRSGGEP